MPRSPRTALVIVHLSSLDSYAYHVGKRAAKHLARTIIRTVNNHHGPVFIVDQGWDGPLSRMINRAVNAPAVWIRFDEDEDDWTEFLTDLRQRLVRDHVKHAIVGGVWYDPSLKEGCATRVYLDLREMLPTTVDSALVGCLDDG